VPHSMDVILNIYDISGKLVKTLVNDMKNTGKHSVIWDGTNQYGNIVANGMYIYKLISSENISISNKMVLLK
jgi:flagellar hook assembly protein FlgD